MIYIKMAARQAIRNIRKNLIIIIVYFFATCALISNIYAAKAIKNSMELSCKKIFTGDIMVKNPQYDFALGEAKSDNMFLVNNVDSLIKELKENDKIYGCLARIRRGVQVFYENESEYMNLIGVNIESEENYSDFGIKDGSIPYGHNEALMSDTYMERLGLSIGDKFSICTMDINNNVSLLEFRLVGILDNENMNFMRQDSLVIRYEDAQHLINSKDTATEVLIFLKSQDNEETVINELNSYVKDYDGYPYSWREVGREIILASLGAYASVSFLAISCSVVICALVFNLTIMNIYRRMNEIGTMLALGIKHFSILAMLCVENILTGISASFIGLIATVLIFKTVLKNGLYIGTAAQIFGQSRLYFDIEATESILITIGIGLLGTLSACITYFTLRKIRPIEAINA